MVVTSFIEGRIRIRDEQLKSAPAAECARKALLAVPGISGVVENRRTGSLLIEYDAAVVNIAALQGMFEAFLPPSREGGKAAPAKAAGPSFSSCRISMDKRQMISTGLLASFLATGAGAALHLKKLHLAAGIVFSVIAGVHMFDKRQKLIP